MTSPAFERPRRAHRSTKNTRDARGSIKVLVVLSNTKGGGLAPVKGNIVRSLTVARSTVSDVFQAIERALFPGG